MKSWLFLALLGLMWGSSYILIKKGLEGFPPVQVASLRIAIAALAFLPVFLLQRKRMPWSKWKPLLLVGLSGNGIPAILFATAQTHLSSSLTGVLSSLTPLFTFVMALLFYDLPFSRARLLGVLLGLAGATLLILQGAPGGASGQDLVYGLLVVVATLMYALSSNTIKSQLNEVSPLITGSAALIFVGLPALGYLCFTDFWTRIAQPGPALTALGYISILSLGGTVVATLFFVELVRAKDAVFASMVSYLIPLVALGWGFLDGEWIGIVHMLGMTFILAGVYLSRR